jgi:hypothetical protein
MQPLKLFIKSQTSNAPGDVLQATGTRLKHYFDRICAQQTRRTFLNATFKVDPSAGEVGDLDLLVYITDGGSYIKRQLDSVFEPGVEHLLPGHPGGGTKKMPNGAVLSEVYWTGGISGLKRAAYDKRAAALANFIFHEWVHNKYSSDPDALSKGEVNGDFVHQFCGGGVLGSSLSYVQAADWEINQANVTAILKVLDKPNKQYTSGLP